MAPNGKDEAPVPKIGAEIEIVLDRPRKLYYDMQACWDAEMLYSQRMGGVKEYAFGDLQASGTVGAICCMLWAGLKSEDPSLTLNDVMKMMRPNRIREVSLLINRAALDQTTVPEGDREAGQKKTDGETKPDSKSGDASGPLPG